MIKKPQFTVHDLLPAFDNMSIYEYFLASTWHHKEDYAMLQFMGKDIMRSEFLADVDSLAYYFKEELGLQTGDAFTLFTPNTIEEVVMLFALNKIGCIAALVHPLIPTEAMRSSVEYTKSKGILILDAMAPLHAKALQEMGVKVVVCAPAVYAVPAEKKFAIRPNEQALSACGEGFDYEFFGDILARNQGKTVDCIKRNGNATALYMNGGGTTGVSRTIRLSSRNINAAINDATDAFIAFDCPAGTYANISALPFFHAFGLCAVLLSALFSGQKSILMPKFDADEYIKLLKNNKIFEVVGVPNMFRKLLDTPEFYGEHLKHVRYAYIGGDNVPFDFLNRFNTIMAENGSIALLMAGYGLTECSACDTTNSLWAYKPGTVGTDLVYSHIEIFDDDYNVVPRGTVGELGMTGEVVMQGYLMPDGRENEGVYIDKDGKRWVMTGDLASMDEEGFITFIARKKRLIIIAGFNVFPADIENLLEPLPFIHECCAVQGYDDNQKPIVRLYITLSENGDIAKLDEYKKVITELCEEKLNSYSVPRDIRVLDAMPRTRMEKIDFVRLTETLD
ncbi:MAG: acyl--CoA ligase [Clostridia bacterium]|nr:acyl--CoA ligase [Clostridia bacterium]